MSEERTNNKDNVIEVRGLTKRVRDATGEITILSDVHFKVRVGETVSIVGSSGSGKSTLLGLLAGLDTPTEGSVHLASVDIFSLNEDKRALLRAEKVGFVFQSFQLLPHLNALENVMLPLELSGRPARDAAVQMLERVGLGERLFHYPKTLSGGEQQRVALARAFVMQPPILLADEPTGSLDAATGQAVMTLMFDMHKESNSTLLLVTHDANIARLCDRQLTIAAGRVVSDTGSF